MVCPSPAELERLLRGATPRETEAQLDAHLAECAECRRLLEELAGGSGWINAGKTARPLPTSSPALDQSLRELESVTPAPADAVGNEPMDFLTPSDQPGVIGKLGGYEILERIASGGMGIVFRARDPGLNRIVAIKVLAPALARNALARARFVREARAAAAVVHEHVVSIHAVEEFNGLPLIVMQFIKGRTLSERLRDTGPMRLEEILRIGAQAAAGLAAAHAQGLVHRDIKPGNILLENGVERVKLTDFGLARAVDDTELTRVGQLAGTPEYMSPEQASGAGVDQRADLFSLGAVLYAMATGQSPFHGGGTMAVLRRVCDGAPRPLSETAPALPGWFAGIVHRLLEKNPAARFQSAAEVAVLLEERLKQCQRGEKPPSPANRKALLLAAGLAGLMLLAGAIFFARHDQPSNPQSPRMIPQGQPAFALVQDGRPGAKFLTLAEAVAAAQSGQTIELIANGRLDCEPVQISGKALRLRAAKGVLPVLYQTDPQAGLLTTDSTLVLEGIAFERAPAETPLVLRAGRNPPALARHADAQPGNPAAGMERDANAAPLIEVRGGKFLATHCRFAVRDGSTVRPDASSAAVRLANVTEARVQHCEILALHSLGVDCPGEPPQFVLTNSVFLGRSLVRIGPPATNTCSVGIYQSTVAAQTIIAPGKALPEGSGLIAFNLHRNLIDVGTAVTIPPTVRDTLDVKSLWRWTGSSNVYDVQEAFLRSKRPRVGDVQSLAAWRQYWPTEEAASLAVAINFPKLPQTPGSITNFNALQFGQTASTAGGAMVNLIGPGTAYHRAGSMADWESVVGQLLADAK